MAGTTATMVNPNNTAFQAAVTNAANRAVDGMMKRMYKELYGTDDKVIVEMYEVSNKHLKNLAGIK